MPLKTVTNLSGTGIVDVMLTNDQGEDPARILDGPVRFTFGVDASAVGLEYEVKSGKFTGVDRGAVQSGGTVGIPPDMQAFGQSVLLPKGTLQFLVRDTTGAGTTELNLFYDIQPLR